MLVLAIISVFLIVIGLGYLTYYYESKPKISAKEQADRKIGIRIEPTGDYYQTNPTSWIKNKWTGYAWIREDRWYAAHLDADRSLIYCGCFSGTLAEFRQRIDSRIRCPEAMQYYNSKYNEFEDFLNLQSPVKASDGDSLSVGVAKTEESGTLNTDASHSATS